MPINGHVPSLGPLFQTGEGADPGYWADPSKEEFRAELVGLGRSHGLGQA